MHSWKHLGMLVRRRQTVSWGISFQSWIMVSVSSWTVCGVTSVASIHNVPEALNWILVWGTWGPVSGISAFIIQKLSTPSGHMRLDFIMHQEEPRAHCTSVRSDNGLEDFIPVANNSKGTVCTCRSLQPSKDISQLSITDLPPNGSCLIMWHLWWIPQLVFLFLVFFSSVISLIAFNSLYHCIAKLWNNTLCALICIRSHILSQKILFQTLDWCYEVSLE